MTAKSFPPLFSFQNPCPPPSSLPATLQNDINSPPGPEPSPPLDDFDLSSLPTGWNNPNTNTTSHSAVVVLALSVALSFIIIILMFSFVFWRRKHSPKRDPEK